MNYLRRFFEVVFLAVALFMAGELVIASTTDQWIELGKIILAACTVFGAFSTFFRVTEYFDPNKDKGNA